MKQDLLLLPGEHAYMEHCGHLAQYEDYRLHSMDYRLSQATLSVDMLSIRTTRGGCPCRHEIRPTACRLYPMLPVYEVGVGVVGIQPYFALEDEVERAAGIPASCRISHLTPNECSELLTIANAIGSNPNCMFHVMAYDCVRRHVRTALEHRVGSHPIDPTPQGVGETMVTLGAELMCGRLFDTEPLKADLDLLAQGFIDAYGPSFQE